MGHLYSMTGKPKRMALVTQGNVLIYSFIPHRTFNTLDDSVSLSFTPWQCSKYPSPPDSYCCYTHQSGNHHMIPFLLSFTNKRFTVQLRTKQQLFHGLDCYLDVKVEYIHFKKHNKTDLEKGRRQLWLLGSAGHRKSCFQVLLL